MNKGHRQQLFIYDCTCELEYDVEIPSSTWNDSGFCLKAKPLDAEIIPSEENVASEVDTH